MLTKKLAWPIIFFIVATGALGMSIARRHYVENCFDQNRKQEYLSSINSCKRAVSLQWFFKSMSPLAYAEALNELGLAELMLYHYTDSKIHLSEALRLHEKYNPTGSTSQAATLSNMGLLNMGLGDIHAQKKWYVQSDAMFSNHAPLCHEGAVRATSSLGLAMNAIRESEESEAILMRRAEQNTQCPQLHGDVRALTLRALGEAQNKNSNEGDALISLDSSISFLQKSHSETNLEMAYAQITRAIILKDLGRDDEAEHSARIAIPILKKIFGGVSISEATARGIIGSILKRQGKLLASEQEFENAEQISRKLLGNNHPRLATILLKKAKLMRLLGRDDEAKLHLNEALRIRIFVFGINSIQVSAVNDEIHDGNTE